MLSDLTPPKISLSRILLTIGVFFIFIGNADAEWVRVGENSRSVGYANNEGIRQSDNNTILVWVLFDYKTKQKFQRSNNYYFSEKVQREINCRDEKDRALFFTRHSERMGYGTVVYTGRNPTKWEPTSAPDNYSHAFWNFYCQ